MKKFYVLEYLYRDADNYKAYGEILLTGKVTNAEITEFKSMLASVEYFIAEQVGIPVLYSELWKYSNGPTIADHVFHEFIDFRIATDEEADTLEIWGDVVTLFSNFRKVGQNWDCRQSVHCSIM